MRNTLFWTGTGMQIFQLLLIVGIALALLPLNWSLVAKGFVLCTFILIILGYNIISWIMIKKGMKEEPRRRR